MQIIPKLEGGGGMPAFVSYTPLTQPTQPAVASAEVKGDKEEKGSVGILSKDMIKALYENGLSSDTESFLQHIDSFISNGEPTMGNPFAVGNKAAQYKKLLLGLNQLKNGKDQLTSAITEARSKEAFTEMAISSDGQYFVLGEKGIETKNKLEPGDRVLTNADLADLRANKMAFNNNITNVISNGVSMKSINAKCLDLISKIGSDTRSNDFLTTKKGKDIKAGLEELLEAGEDGVYKVNQSTKTSGDINTPGSKANLALNYIMSTLSPNEQALLKGKASLGGLEPAKGAVQLLASLVTMGTSSEVKTTVNYDTAATQGIKDKEGKTSADKVGIIQQIQSGLGGDDRRFVLNPGKMNEIDAGAKLYGSLKGQDGKIIPEGSLKSVLDSGLGSIIDKSNIRFGNQKLSSTNFDKVFAKSDSPATVNLPVTKDKFGQVTPDFDVIRRYSLFEKRLEYFKKKGLSDKAFKIGVDRAITDYGLEALFTKDKAGQLVKDPHKFNKFLIINGMASDEEGVVNPEISDWMTKTKDEGLKNKMLSSLSKDNPSYKVNDVYLGTIYAPLLQNPNAGATSDKNGFSLADEAFLQQYNKQPELQEKIKTTSSNKL